MTVHDGVNLRKFYRGDNLMGKARMGRKTIYTRRPKGGERRTRVVVRKTRNK
jgi:hypothetical protein